VNDDRDNSRIIKCMEKVHTTIQAEATIRVIGLKGIKWVMASSIGTMEIDMRVNSRMIRGTEQVHNIMRMGTTTLVIG
jgi:hypothetical protein